MRDNNCFTWYYSRSTDIIQDRLKVSKIKNKNGVNAEKSKRIILYILYLVILSVGKYKTSGEL